MPDVFFPFFGYQTLRGIGESVGGLNADYHLAGLAVGAARLAAKPGKTELPRDLEDESNDRTRRSRDAESESWFRGCSAQTTVAKRFDSPLSPSLLVR